MSDLVACLYRFVHENRMGVYLYHDKEYKSYQRMAQTCLDKLENLLSEEASKELSDYLEDQLIIQSVETEAAFTCGLEIGLELSALGRLPG